MGDEAPPGAGTRRGPEDLAATDLGSFLVHLTTGERDCLLRFLSLLAERLGENLAQVWLCGSAARGDMWPDWMPMHSDIDLLVLSQRPVAAAVKAELINATYPLFLECGRQISPQFRTVEQFRSPPDERTLRFAAQVRSEGWVIYRAPRETAGTSGPGADGPDS
jgi:hypothetical protein